MRTPGCLSTLHGLALWWIPLVAHLFLLLFLTVTSLCPCVCLCMCMCMCMCVCQVFSRGLVSVTGSGKTSPAVASSTSAAPTSSDVREMLKSETDVRLPRMVRCCGVFSTLCLCFCLCLA
jgi:hypothetical protein